MAKTITRRQFVKVAAGIAGAVATGSTPLVRHAIREPFVRPPEETLPGEATWYASTCRQCPAGCGIIVRTINGRAKKIEGNPLHPLNHGKLCARGQAGLQVLYNPDRLKNAVQQTEGRGSRQFEPLYWTDAIKLLHEKISTLTSPERLAMLGGLMPDHQYLLFDQLLKALGAPPPVIFDVHASLEGRITTLQHSQTFFGTPELPIYDLANTDVILSFGANFLETWMSPVAQSHAYGVLRQGQSGGRGFFVQFEPRLSATAASADEWIPVRPGTEGFIALALGRIIVEENLGHVGSHRPHAMLYQDIDVRDMAERTEIPVETLFRLARTFADADQSVAIPGGYLAGQQNGLSSMLAVQTLNLLVAQLGRTGGVFLAQPSPTVMLRQGTQPGSFDQITDLVHRMANGQVELLLISGTNPVFDLPQAVGFTEALNNVPFVVSFSSFIDDTGIQADLILPDHSYLESWGFQIPRPGADRPVISGQQPVVRPLYDTRATVDVLLELAAQLGGAAAEALPWANEVAYLQELVGKLQGSSLSIYDAETLAGFWVLWRQYGGWWSEKGITREPETTLIVSQPLSVDQPTFEGDSQTYPYSLYPYSSLTLTDGRGANLPLLQETPDPMTTARWGTWVELNPETARSLGVGDNDIVRVISPHGQIEVPVVVYPGISPDVVAIPIGQGHTDYGRFAAERGANPLKLLAPVAAPDSGELAWGATLVRVDTTTDRRELARLENLDGEGRESLR
jgi:anaerobic selenocysteine-containing dehydrogenase